MNENEFLVVLGAFGVLLGVAWWTSIKLLRMEIQQNATDLEPMLAHLVSEMRDMVPSEIGVNDIGESIKDAIANTVEDVLGDMHVPTGMDHVLGALSAFVQAKFLNQMPPGIPEALATLNEGEIDTP